MTHYIVHRVRFLELELVIISGPEKKHFQQAFEGRWWRWMPKYPGNPSVANIGAGTMPIVEKAGHGRLAEIAAR